MAFGFALIYNTTRTFHFAHGAVYTFTIYAVYTLSTLCGWPLWLAAVAALTLAALLGILVNELVYRPLVERHATPLVRLLSSLGTYLIVVNLITLVFGNEVIVLAPGMQPMVNVGSVLVSRIQLLTVAACTLIFASLLLLLRLTQLGRLIRAMSDDPELVAVLGTDPQNVRRLVFALGSTLAGAAAILKGLDVGTEPQVGMGAFLTGAVAMIIGGVGVFEGVVVGGLLVGVLQSFAVWSFSTKWQDAVTFLLLIVFLLFRPEGLLGRRRRVAGVVV